MPLRSVVVVALTFSPLLISCEANQLYMANHTVVGINASVNPEQGTGSLLIGYDRAFATVIPRSVEQQATAPDGTPMFDSTGKPKLTGKYDAMSALVCA